MRRAIAICVLTILFAPTSSISTCDDRTSKKGDQPKYDPIELYAEQHIEGWKIFVHKRLAKEDQQELRRQTLKVLAESLFRISRVVPEAALEKLRAVPIWIEVAHPRHPCMCYHLSADWLLEHDMNPDKLGAVEISNCKNFLSWTVDQPWMVLHELAHAYHHRFVGLNDSGIEAAYQRAVEGKRYESVLHIRGEQRRHYAINNSQEYFAEATESYFGTNDFYPFVRAELKQHDPTMYQLIENTWLVEEADTAK